VDGIACGGSEASWDGIDTRQVIDQFSRFRITLSSDFVGFGVEENAACRINVTDVFVGPFDF
jgi:hypothetical protein